MAEFNPEVPQAPNTNWLNASQGYQSNKVIGNLFKGFAATTDTAIKSYDESKRTQIQLAASSNVEGIATAKPTEPVQIPDGLKTSLGKLDQYRNALDQGVMTDLEFKVRLDKTAKEMRRTFGSGYSDVIDNALANAQGVSTANQLRDELLKQIDAENKNADDMTKRKLSFLTSDAGKYLTDPNVLASYEAQTGVKFNPNDFNLVAAAMAVNAQQAKEHGVAVRKAQVELAQAENTATVDQVKRVASLEVADLVQKGLNKEAYPRLKAVQDAAISAEGPGGASVTPQERAQLESMWNTLELEVRSKVNDILTDPNEVYSTTIVNQKDRDDIANIALGTLAIYKESLNGEQFGILGAVSRQNAAITADATYNILNDPRYGKIQSKIAAMKSLGYDMDLVNKAIQSMSFTGKDGKPVSGASYQNQMLQEQIFANFLASDVGTAELITEFTNAGLPAIQTRKALEERVKLVTDPANSPDKAASMMRNLFGDQESQNFIEEFAQTDPMGMFAMLASKQMTDKMYQTEMFGQYQAWIMNQFAGISQPLRADIISAQTGSDTSFVKWDGKQFKIEGQGAGVLFKNITPQGPLGPLASPVQFGQNVSEYNTYRNALKAVNDMNAYIALLDYAISKDSANTDGVAPYIELLFDGVPVQDRKKQGNMLTQMKKAIGEFLDEAAKDTAEALR